MSNNFTELSSLLASRTLTREVIRPLFSGPIMYSDGTGKPVDLITMIPKALPKRYYSAERIEKPMIITREQCVNLIRAFRNHNTVEAACILVNLKHRHFLDLQRTWAVSSTSETAIPKQYIPANKFIETLFLAFNYASNLAERELIQVVSDAALVGSEERTTKTVQYFDERGQPVGAKTETVVRQKPPSTDAAIWMLERISPERWASRKQVEHTGHITHGLAGQDVPSDPLSVVLGAIDEIGRNPLPLPEVPADDSIDAQFTDMETSVDDGGD